jgi:hypothetical protein
MEAQMVLDWFDWAGDYRLPVALAFIVGAEVIVVSAFVITMVSASDWINDYKCWRGRKADRKIFNGQVD